MVGKIGDRHSQSCEKIGKPVEMDVLGCGSIGATGFFSRLLAWIIHEIRSEEQASPVAANGLYLEEVS